MRLDYNLLEDGRKAFFELSRIDRFFHLFWLLGPFFFLIERTPGDVYISIIALAFVVRSLKTSDSNWLKFLWLGEWLQRFIEQDLFRKIVLWAFLIMGGRLTIMGLF